MKPVYRDGQFVPRLMLPLSLSYDHRVIDGATAARFTSHLGRGSRRPAASAAVKFSHPGGPIRSRAHPCIHE